MTIYLRSTPSLNRKKKMTKKQRLLLDEYNKQRRELGMAPVSSLRTPKSEKEKYKTKFPSYDHAWRRPRQTDKIPSHQGPVVPGSTARQSIMESVLRGQESPEVAEEILRKSRCLAPAYSKGAVQYISSEEMARDAGRKK